MTGRLSRPPGRWLWPGPLLLAVFAADVFTIWDGRNGFDRTLMLALRVRGNPGEPLGPAWLAETGRDLTALGSNGVTALLVLAVSGYLRLMGRTRHAASLILASGSAVVLNGLIKTAVQRVRPDLIPDTPRVFTTSFPSSHAMVSAAMLFTLAAIGAAAHHGAGLRWFCFAMAAVGTGLVGLSRVYLGVHWPTDVVGGWTAGLFCAWAAWMAVGSDPSRPERYCGGAERNDGGSI